MDRTRRAVSGVAAVCMLAGVLTTAGVVALPGSAAATDVELWRLDAEPDAFDRYVAVVADEHLALPGRASAAPAAPASAAGPGAGLDPRELAEATAAVGEPAELETVDGRLQLRGPRGVRVLGGPAKAPVPSTTSALGATLDTPPSAVSRGLLQRLAATPGIAAVAPLHGGRVVLSVPRGRGEPVGLDGLERVTEDVAGAVADLAGLPDDPLIGSAWALHNGGALPGLHADMALGADLGALGAWTRTRGAGVTVAVLDTGYAPHRDLAGTLWTNDDACTNRTDADGNGWVGDCHGWNFATGDNDITNASADAQRNMHGTAVGSVIAGSIGNGYAAGGIAPDVEVMPLVVGSGSSVSLSAVVEAIYYAVDNGADVINMSFGFTLSGSEELASLETAMAYAADRDVLLVAAAGNDGEDRDRTPSYPASSTNPNLLTVGASTGADDRASFSAYGATSVDVFAPGLYVLAGTSQDGMMLASGTSLSAPLTAGVAALLKSVDPTLVGSDLRARIIASAADRPAMAASVSGGRVDARAALAALPAPVGIDVDGLDDVQPDAPASYTVRLTGTGTGLPAGVLGLRQRLVTQESDGGIYAVAGAPVDGGRAGSGTTDEHGVLQLAPPGLKAQSLPAGVAVPVQTSLPTGRYVVLLSLTRDGVAVGGTYVVPFTVGSPPPVSPSPTATASAAPPASAPGTSPALPSSPVDNPAGTFNPPAGDSTERTSPDSADPAGWAPPAGSSTPPPALPQAPPPPAAGTSAAPAPATTAPAAAPAPASSSAPAAGGSSGPARSAPGPRPTADPDADYYVPPPNAFGITRMTPATGSTKGGTSVVFTGSAIPRDASVLFGGAPATIVVNGAPEYVEVSTPARAAGRVDVQLYDNERDSFDADLESVYFEEAFLYELGDGSESAPRPAAPAGRAAPSAAVSPGSLRRGELTLNPVTDVDGTLFGMAACQAACTAMRL